MPAPRNKVSEGDRQVAELFAAAVKRNSSSIVATAREANLTDDVLGNLLKAERPFRVEEVVRLSRLLGVRPESVHEAMFGLPPRADAHLQLGEVVQDVTRVMKALRIAENPDPTAEVMTRLLATGRWSVHMAPSFQGPGPGNEFHTSNYVLARLVAGGRDGLPADPRAQFHLDVELDGSSPEVSFTNMLTVAQQPHLPLMSPETDVLVRTSVLGSGLNTPAAERAHLDSTRSVVVVSFTESSGAFDVAAILARALGWSMGGSIGQARRQGLVPPPAGTDGRSYAGESSDAGLRLLRLAMTADRLHEVFYHRGLPSRDNGVYDASTHPLLDDDFEPSAPDQHLVLLVPDEQHIEEVHRSPADSFGTKRKWTTQQLKLWSEQAAARCTELGGQVIELKYIAPSVNAHGRWTRHASVIDEVLFKIITKEGLKTRNFHVHDRTALRVLKASQPHRWS